MIAEIRVELAALVKKRAVKLRRTLYCLAEIATGNDAVTHHAKRARRHQFAPGGTEGFVLKQAQYTLIHARVLHRADLTAIGGMLFVQRIEFQTGIVEHKTEVVSFVTHHA